MIKHLLGTIIVCCMMLGVSHAAISSSLSRALDTYIQSQGKPVLFSLRRAVTKLQRVYSGDTQKMTLYRDIAAYLDQEIAEFQSTHTPLDLPEIGERLRYPKTCKNLKISKYKDHTTSYENSYYFSGCAGGNRNKIDDITIRTYSLQTVIGYDPCKNAGDDELCFGEIFGGHKKDFELYDTIGSIDKTMGTNYHSINYSGKEIGFTGFYNKWIYVNSFEYVSSTQRFQDFLLYYMRFEQKRKVILKAYMGIGGLLVDDYGVLWRPHLSEGESLFKSFYFEKL